MNLARRRLDAKGPAGTSPKQGAKYRDLNKKDMVPVKYPVIAIGKELLKQG